MPVAAGKNMANTEKNPSPLLKSGPKFSANIDAANIVRMKCNNRIWFQSYLMKEVSKSVFHIWTTGIESVSHHITGKVNLISLVCSSEGCACLHLRATDPCWRDTSVTAALALSSVLKFVCALLLYKWLKLHLTVLSDAAAETDSKLEMKSILFVCKLT